MLTEKLGLFENENAIFLAQISKMSRTIGIWSLTTKLMNKSLAPLKMIEENLAFISKILRIIFKSLNLS